MRTALWVIVMAAGVGWGADPPAVSGTWQFDPAQAGKLKIAALTIHQSPDTIQLSELPGSDAKAKKIDLECALGAPQCRIKDADEEVSFWYNGAALVMMEMRHGKEVVIKTKLEPSADGKTLHMEVTHIAPAGHKDESYTLTRQGS